VSTRGRTRRAWVRGAREHIPGTAWRAGGKGAASWARPRPGYHVVHGHEAHAERRGAQLSVRRVCRCAPARGGVSRVRGQGADKRAHIVRLLSGRATDVRTGGCVGASKAGKGVEEDKRKQRYILAATMAMVRREARRGPCAMQNAMKRAFSDVSKVARGKYLLA
jgi:hypothetical protein